MPFRIIVQHLTESPSETQKHLAHFAERAEASNASLLAHEKALQAQFDELHVAMERIEALAARLEARATLLALPAPLAAPAPSIDVPYALTPDL